MAFSTEFEVTKRNMGKRLSAFLGVMIVLYEGGATHLKGYRNGRCPKTEMKNLSDFFFIQGFSLLVPVW